MRLENFLMLDRVAHVDSGGMRLLASSTVPVESPVF